MTELPIVHDFYAVQATVDRGCLRLLLQWREYSRTTNSLIVTNSRWLCFSKIGDPQERPPSDSRSKVRNLWDLLFRVLGVEHDPSKMLTAQQFIENLNHPHTAYGEPLNDLEPGFGGIVLLTHLVGDVFIASREVAWCDDLAID